MLPYFRFHHIGIATFCIEDTSAFYMGAGYSKSDTIYDPSQDVNICFLEKKGMPLLELLEPNDDKSPICKTLEKNGVSPYHCCYEVDNLDLARKDLRTLGYLPISKPEHALAINGRMVQFFYNRKVGIIEVVEK